MTNKEIENAIKVLDSVCEDRQFDIGCFNKCETDGRDCFVKIAKKALEKQTEIVHCKECKHWVSDVTGCTENVKRCEFANWMVGENGFCVYGERCDK